MIVYNGPFCVYAHINKINGKIYIGITKKSNPNGRWKSGNGYSYNWHFYQSIKKYGWENFEHEIIAMNLTEEEASNMERLLIEKLKTTDYRYGYNSADGGYNNRGLSGEKNPFYHKVPTKAVEASIKARTGNPLSEEHKEKIRQGNIKAGINKNSLDALIKWQKLKKNWAKGAANPTSRAVKCIETGVVYESQRIAEQELGLPTGSIHQAIKFNIRAKGLHFERVSNSNDQSKDVGSSDPKRRDA